MTYRNGSGRVVLYFRDRVLRFALIKMSFMFAKPSVSPSSLLIIGRYGMLGSTVIEPSLSSDFLSLYLLNAQLFFVRERGVGSYGVYQMNALAYCPFNYFCP